MSVCLLPLRFRFPNLLLSSTPQSPFHRRDSLRLRSLTSATILSSSSRADPHDEHDSKGQQCFSWSNCARYKRVLFLFSGDEWSQVAYVTFKDSQGVETALLLSGATIVDLSVIVSIAQDYQLPPAALTHGNATAPQVPNQTKTGQSSESAMQKAEDAISGVLAKGLLLGKDVFNKAKSFDEKHQLTSTASTKVSSLDKKIGLSEKVSMGASLVNEKVKGVDQKLQVSDKAKSAFATAEEKVGNAGSAVLKNRYVYTGVSFVTSAFSKVSKAAGDMTSKTKEKVLAQQQQVQSHMEAQHTQVPSPQLPPAQSMETPTNPQPQVPPAQSVETTTTPPPPYDSIH